MLLPNVYLPSLAPVGFLFPVHTCDSFRKRYFRRTCNHSNTTAAVAYTSTRASRDFDQEACPPPCRFRRPGQRSILPGRASPCRRCTSAWCRIGSDESRSQQAERGGLVFREEETPNLHTEVFLDATRNSPSMRSSSTSQALNMPVQHTRWVR